MDDELVLLTSYFNLVDGRRQDAADTFRVDTNLPSASSPDGSAALYIVTESSTTGHMGPRARRLAADTIAWEYSSHSEETPPVRLKSALRSAHTEVSREFDGHVAVGATVMAVERDTVYLAQVAPSQVYVLHEGSLNSIPATVNGDSPFSAALGSRVSPKISIFRDQVAPGDVIGLCSSWFDSSADTAELRQCFGGGTSDEIAEALLELAQRDDVRDVTAIIIEAALSGELEVVPTGDEAPGFMEQVDIAVQALASVGRMIWGELHPTTSNGGSGSSSQDTARSPVGSASDTAEVPLVSTEPAEPTSPLPGQQASTIAEPEDQSLSDGDLYGPIPDEPRPEPSSRMPREDITDEVPRVPPPTPAPTPTPTLKPSPEPEPTESLSELEQVNSRLHDGPDMEDVIPPVQAFEDMGTEPARIYATNKDIQAANRRPRRFAGAASVPVIRPGLGDIDLRQPISRPTPPALVWGTLAALLVVAVLAVGVYALGHFKNKPATNPYIALVRTDITKAKAAKTAANQDYYLNKAKQNIALAQQNGASSAWVTAHQAQLQTTSDSLHHITRETNPILLTDFSKFPGSSPTNIAAAPGIVYVVDPSRKSLFSVQAKPNSNPTEIAQAGDVYTGFTMGIPQHVAVDGTTALALDDKNVLLRDTAGTKTATALSQQNQTPGKFVSIAASDPDLYVLDTANSQVWRYPYAVSGYNPTQAAYWDTNAPKLNDGVAIAFDKTDLYILKSDGTVLKFDFQANPLKFTINLKQPLQKPVAMYTDAGQQWIWIADPVNKRIVQLDKNGAYAHSYLSSTNALDFSKLQSISIGPDGKTIYVLAGSRLYDFPVAS